MSPELHEYFGFALHLLNSAPVEAVFALAIGLLAWRLAKDLYFFLCLPEPMRRLGSLHRDSKTRADIERKTFEIRAQEDLEYQAWEARRRRVLREGKELVSTALRLAALRKRAQTGDRQVDAAMAERFATLVSELHASPSIR